MTQHRTASATHHPRTRLRHRIFLTLAIAALSLLALPLLNRFTHHAGESVLVLMVPTLGILLWFGWPRVRNIAWWKYFLYLALLTPVLAAAVYFVAHVARGRLLWIEVFWALYFTIAWRLAWTLWTFTIGRLGERWRRWGRRRRRRLRHTPHTIHRLALATMLIRPARALLVLLLFVPLAFGSLVHRIKIGNPTQLTDYSYLSLKPVSFRTDDGLTLSGWFSPERDSDSTVLICHGAGANKYNFLDFVLLFRGQGYNTLIFDFRGHGDSDGHTCTFGLYEEADVKAAVDWLKKEQPGRARHIYGIGSSMGAMALVRQAAHDPRIETVILDSCFASGPLLARQHLGRIPLLGWPLETMVLGSLSLHAGRSFWDLDARSAIGQISPRPVLLIHGSEDVLIPPVNMEILFDCAAPPKDKWLGPGPHSNVMTTDFLEYQRRVIALLDKASHLQAQ